MIVFVLNKEYTRRMVFIMDNFFDIYDNFKKNSDY